eukprot:2610571-Prymnesium_polylepis.1
MKAGRALRDLAGRDSTNSDTLVQQKALYRRLSGYPLVLLLTWLPATIRRVWKVAAPDSLETSGIDTELAA